MSFGQPNGKLIDDSGSAVVTFRSWISMVHTIANSLQQSGTTAKRPTEVLWIGRRYFDTTLGIPIWVQSVGPVVWCNASGVAV